MMFFPGARLSGHRARPARAWSLLRKRSTSNEMDTYAADVAELVAALGLSNAREFMSAIRRASGEVARYVAQHGGGRVAKAVLISRRCRR